MRTQVVDGLLADLLQDVRFCVCKSEWQPWRCSHLIKWQHCYNLLCWCNVLRWIRCLCDVTLWVYIHTRQAWKICLATVGLTSHKHCYNLLTNLLQSTSLLRTTSCEIFTCVVQFVIHFSFCNSGTNYCKSFPCGNNGICQHEYRYDHETVVVSNYSCDCFVGWEGRNCWRRIREIGMCNYSRFRAYRSTELNDTMRN
jgi:hypothetical protein